MFALAGYFVLVIILTFVPCGFGATACVLNADSMPFIERPDVYFSQITSDGALFFFVLLAICSIAFFKVLGVTITKNINAIARTIGDVTRTILVWMVGIILTLTAGVNMPNYQWEMIGAGPILLQLVGFTTLVIGNLVYNNLIKVPFLEPKELVSKNLII